MAFNNYDVLDIAAGVRHTFALLSSKIKTVRDSPQYEKYMLKLRNHPMKAARIREEMVLNGIDIGSVKPR
jgi:hypothetical protein